MPTKTKKPRLTKARKAIFAKYADKPWCTPEFIKQNHEALSLKIDNLVAYHTEKDPGRFNFTGDPETDGNQIIESYLAGYAERERKQAAKRETHIKHVVEFQRIFGVALHKFSHPIFGFDVIAFDEIVIRPPEGVSTSEAIEQKYGTHARRMIEELIGI